MTRSTLQKLLAPAALAAALTAGEPARADTRAEEAQHLFDEAMALMMGNRAPEACPRLEAAQRLDPGMATEFRLAECYEKIGRTASAHALFLKVAGEARGANSRERAEFAEKRAAALEPKLAKLALSVSPSVSALAGLAISLDSVTLARSSWGAPAPTDPGDHIIEATARGRKPWRATVHVDTTPGTTIREVPMLEPAPEAPAPAPVSPPPAAESSSPGWSTQRKVGLGVGAVGVIGVIVGAVFGVETFVKVGNANCTGSHPARCPDQASAALAQQANRTANVSNVAFAVGGAAVIGGVVLFATAPSGAAKPKGSARLSAGVSTTGLLLRGEW